MVIGKKVYRQHTVINSMAWAQEHSNDAPDGSVFLADVLTGAKGRHNRTWHIHPGQLIVTFVLKPAATFFTTPEDNAIRLNQLSMALSLGIVGPLKAYGATLKWPNDFVIGQKKIGGMLMQVVWQSTTPHSIIVGFALNVNNTFANNDPLAVRATSLCSITGAELDRRTLYKDILSHLNRWYLEWKHHNFAEIYRQWRSEQSYLGQHLSLHQWDGLLINGRAQQVFPNGDLALLNEDGKQKIISFYQIEEITKP
jgi:BirA family transcriptional regulator, biotin operon repressor / biotin---[acetyl-CoA-carboxylase] ligase